MAKLSSNGRLDQPDPESNLAKFLDALSRGDKGECLRLLVCEYVSMPNRHKKKSYFVAGKK